MITGTEMGVVDENAEALGVPRKQLMESSGNAVAAEVREVADPGDTVAIVAGRGNNGGDAFVAARFLDAYDVRVRLLGRAETITTDIARENWAALLAAEYDAEAVRDSSAVDFSGADVIVDAILGTGIAGALREPAATAAAAMNARDAPVVAVDVPSGLNADTGEVAANAVEADHVVTFHDTKPGLADLATAVTVADIGIPDAASLFVERGDLRRLARDPGSHKGENGEVLVVGGGPYTGAPALAAQAALRAGADLVRVAVPEAVARELQGYSEDLIVRPYDGGRLTDGAVDRVLGLAEDHHATILGPGLGDAPETLEAVRSILASLEGTAVVDADAVSVVPAVDTDADLLCTPHQGELLAMGGETSDDWRERADLVEAFAEELGQTLLVKGPCDVVSNGERTRVGRTGNAGMTVGGTGDVLAGLAGALACVLPREHAGAVGAYANGRAGDIVAEERGAGLVASDLLTELPGVLYDRRG